jgi:M-phase inducer tyrosine phosphatase
METSSPLAAMHRPAPMFGKRDAFQPRVGGDFTFRDQFRGQLDYFGIKPVHGSSPAGSLAADLCQNFTIGEDTRSVAGVR